MNTAPVTARPRAMNTRTRALAALLPAAMLAFAACGGDDKEEDKTAPTISAFSASPMTVTAGQTVTLSWTAANADSIQIVATPGGEVVKTQTLSGTQVSAAIDANTTFVLTASKGDKTATRTVMVSVVQVGAPTIESFTATPATVTAGSPTMLAWQTTNADTVDVVAAGRSIVTAGAADGTISDVPTTMMTTYVLTARGGGMTSTAMVVVTITAGVTPPMITSFVAMPAAIDAGASSTLRWTVAGDALAIRITAGGTEVFSGANGMGSTVVMPTVSTTYILTATNPAGMVMQSTMLTVNPLMGAAVTSFTANPTAVTHGVSSALSWVVTNATSVQITANGAAVTTSMALTGNFTVTPTVTTDYLLTAVNVNGNATAMARVTFNPTAPIITSFISTATITGRGDDVTLRWQTLGATSSPRSRLACRRLGRRSGLGVLPPTLRDSRDQLLARKHAKARHIELSGQRMELCEVTVFERGGGHRSGTI